MASLIVFRGKAATGKSAVSSIISRETGICVLRKDDIFDPLSLYLNDNPKNNAACYDILAKMAQANLDNGLDIILDIALPHTSHFEMKKWISTL